MVSAARNQQLFAMRHDLANVFFGIGVVHAGADRHPDQQVLALAPGHLPAHTVLAAFGTMVTLMAKIDQRIQTAVADQQDTAAVTAVTAIRAALGDELFAPKAHAAVAAIPGLDLDNRFVDEFHASAPALARFAVCRNEKSPVDRRGLLLRSARRRSGRIDTHKLAIVRALGLKTYRTVSLCVQGMVLAAADVYACMNAGTTLAHDDAACIDNLATEDFDAEAFAF